MIGAFLSTTVIGHGIIHFVAICASVAAFVFGAVVFVSGVYALLSEYIVGAAGEFPAYTDLYLFVGYVLNFRFLKIFFSFYYFAFCTIVIGFISLSIAQFVSHVYPSVMMFIRSSLNWRGGDS